MECIGLNWLCKHTKKVRSSQAAILILNWAKHKLFHVSIVKESYNRIGWPRAFCPKTPEMDFSLNKPFRRIVDNFHFQLFLTKTNHSSSLFSETFENFLGSNRERRNSHVLTLFKCLWIPKFMCNIKKSN